jgi:hypothetical protein
MRPWAWIALMISMMVVEYFVFIWPFHKDMLANRPGECSGYTTYYSERFGPRRFDCMGNRHPNDQVGGLPRSTAPEEDVVGSPYGGAPVDPEGWRPRRY